MTPKIGIVGASGFVGSTLCERLYFSGDRDFVPFVHSSGNAWRIARFPVEIQSLDLLNKEQVAKAVSQCTTIINCALANDDPSAQGLRNLTLAARKAGVQRFVHLSSIAIYGRDPADNSTTEAGHPDPQGNAYGIVKLLQDRIVLDLHRAGVPSVILCPGNIGGPYSLFMRGLAERLMQGPLPLVDGGTLPSNVIHVDNLVEAILAAAYSGVGTGERYFVNEVRPVPWREMFDDVARLLGIRPTYVEVRREDVAPFLNSVEASVGLTGHAKIAMSGEFRAALSALPVFRSLNTRAVQLFGKLPQQHQLRIRERFTWPIRVSRRETGPSLDDRYVTVQARRFYHSPQKLLDTFGWVPPLTYQQGLETTAAWLRFAGVRSTS